MVFDGEEFLEQLDLFWGSLFSYNHALMKRSEDESCKGAESFVDIMDFYLTSQAQCFIKDFLLHHIGSPGMLLAARCFLEGLAIKKMFDRGKISELQVELLRHQVSLIEYNYYKEFEDIANIILLPEKLEQDKKEAEKFFKERLFHLYTEKKIDNIVKTNKPFLCDPNINFRKLVGENLGEEYAQIYGLYSQAIHPSINDFYMNEYVWQFIPDIMRLIVEEYNGIPASELSFRSYYKLVLSSDISQRYEELVRRECNILFEIGEVFKKFFDKNYTSDTLTSLSLLMHEMCTDKLLGLCEQVKSKWKIVLDIFASFYECHIASFPYEERFKLLEEHEHVQFQRNIHKEYSIEKAYELYKKLYPNGVGKETFQDAFLTMSGYTINEKGNTKNLTKLVRIFVDKFSDANSPMAWNRSLLLDYMESQMLSHANGYMWYTNSGAWGDVRNVIMGTDMCLLFTLNAILSIFKEHSAVEQTKRYKQIINIIRNSIKRMDAICDEKAKILSLPVVSI